MSEGALEGLAWAVHISIARRTGHHTPSGRKQASGSTTRLRKPRDGLTPPYRDSSRLDNKNNDDDTPPLNKQATNPVSHNTGFFFAWLAGGPDQTGPEALNRRAAKTAFFSRPAIEGFRPQS